MARGKAWTSNEDRTIKDIVEKGFGSNHIGEVIGRSRDGVRKRIKQLGLKDEENQEIEATEEQPQEIIKPDPVEPTVKRRYKIRYKDNMRTYEIIRIEDVEILTPDTIIQEIQQGIEEKFGHIEPKEETVEEQEPTQEETTNTVEEVYPVEYEGTIELTTQELPLAYYDCDRCLTVKGITLSPEETLKVVDFAVQVWKTL